MSARQRAANRRLSLFRPLLVRPSRVGLPALLVLSNASCGSHVAHVDRVSPTDTGRPEHTLPLDSASPEGRCRSLIEVGLTHGRAWEFLDGLLKAAPKRLSGSPGDAKAVTWATATMREIGLENVREEPVTVTHWERGPVERVQLVTANGDVDIPCTSLGGSVGTKPIEADLVIVRSPLELESLDVKGKVVLFNRPMPRALRNTFQAYSAAVPQRSSGPVEAAKRGAVACLVRSMTTLIDDHPHTGATNYEFGVRRIPALAISTVAAEGLANLVERGETPRVKIESSAKTIGDAESANVIGELRGTKHPDEVILIGAHLDAWDTGQGAHDDGAGVVHCLEALRLIRACGFELDRTIRCVLFANEESGLRGSRAYFEAHADDLHKAAIESDRGGFEPKGFTTSAGTERRERLVEMLAPLATEIDAGRLIGGGGGADIAPLSARGVELFGLLPAWHRYFDYHHSVLDSLDAVNPRELQLGAVALAWLALQLANE
ncbi:MAG: M20/M25/M40 family metallo-hydrolase [Planctomycetes bacterium]|nr:M20/M25/M40 family metallo-hydrolase [Planctomycetota bacterium]MCB9892623.1 M20/M25/M40 family metallo-hydrolase [Planctomycetota bacterium]MCB9917555.1 M20/M25/M40 family metallo-hydrolase [Planctomycetota bacterium]